MHVPSVSSRRLLHPSSDTRSLTVAWMEVFNVDGESKKAPFFHLSQGTADTEEVQIITQGNWAISFLETEVRHDRKIIPTKGD